MINDKNIILKVIRTIFLFNKKDENHYVILALDIPLSDDEFLGENLYFNKWIPTEKNSIYIEDDLYILKLWIDKTCISSLSDKTDDEISQWTNISVSKFKNRSQN
jgi:hypothetical protein